jgi:hypothetical protein
VARHHDRVLPAGPGPGHGDRADPHAPRRCRHRSGRTGPRDRRTSSIAVPCLVRRGPGRGGPGPGRTPGAPGRVRSSRRDHDGPAAGPRRQGGNSNPVRHRPGTRGRQQACSSGKAGIQTGPAQRGNQGLQPGPERPGAHDQCRAGRHSSCPSGAALILGWRSGELLDFIPAYTATRGGLLSDCHLINESVAAAKVVDAGGRQLTAMAFEAEQYRQLQALGEPVGGPARITALGVAVQVHPTRTPSPPPPAASSTRPQTPIRNPRRTTASRAGPGRPGWQPNRSSPTASSPTLPRPGPVPACPAPSSKPGTTSARSPGSCSPSPPSAPPDSRPTCAWLAASIPACQRLATSSAAPSFCPPPSTPPPSTAGSMSSDEAAARRAGPGARGLREALGWRCVWWPGPGDVTGGPGTPHPRHSALRGPWPSGVVPDDYLAGLGPQTAITAAELCTAG